MGWHISMNRSCWKNAQVALEGTSLNLKVKWFVGSLDVFFHWLWSHEVFLPPIPQTPPTSFTRMTGPSTSCILGATPVPHPWLINPECLITKVCPSPHGNLCLHQVHAYGHRFGVIIVKEASCIVVVGFWPNHAVIDRPNLDGPGYQYLRIPKCDIQMNSSKSEPP